MSNIWLHSIMLRSMHVQHHWTPAGGNLQTLPLVVYDSALACALCCSSWCMRAEHTYCAVLYIISETMHTEASYLGGT